MFRRCSAVLLNAFLLASVLNAQTPQYPNYPSETPAKFQPLAGGEK